MAIAKKEIERRITSPHRQTYLRDWIYGGVDENNKRRGLGVSVSLSEAEVHWRAFLEALVSRGMHGH